MKSTKRIVLLALLVAQALVLSIVESWIPNPVAIPGVKLGLANIIILTTIAFFRFSDVLLVVFVKTLVSSLFAGGPVVFLFSLAGGLLSSIVMYVLYKKMLKNFSVLGISIAGAVAHNFGQLAVASIIMKELAVLFYLPVLLVSGIIMGCFVGLCSNFLIKALEKSRIMTLD